MARKQFQLDSWLKDKSQKVVTRCGYPVRIVCWDMKRDSRPILAVMDYGEREEYSSYNEDGRFEDECECNYDLFIETDEPEVSENERIRKTLIDFFSKGAKLNGTTNGVADKDILAWLEKQGTPAKLVLTSCALSFIDYLDAHKYEGKMCVSNGECEDIENAFHNAMWDKLHRYYCKYIEKQGEQKPEENKGNLGGISLNWSEEDEKNLRRAIRATKVVYPVAAYWLQSLQDRVQPQPKQGWRAEEEAVLDALIRRLEGEDIYVSPHLAVECLKSLKDRVLSQPKQEWSEEDKYMYDILCGTIENTDINENTKYTLISWLKSLRPQNRWKPSDEQIKVCKEVYADILSAKGFDLGTVNDELNRLEEELKKLKKE